MYNQCFAQYYSETIYTTKDGLKSNEIKDIIQAKDGNLWMINAGELCKFDGNDFTYYSLKNDIIADWDETDLTELISGEIMIRSTQFSKFNPKTEKFIYYVDPPIEATKYPDKNGDIKGSMPPNLAPFDSDGNVWYTSYTDVFKVFEDVYQKLPNQSNSNPHFQYHKFKDQNGTIWAQSYKTEVYQLKDSTIKMFNLLPFAYDSSKFQCTVLFIDSDNNILFKNNYEGYDDNWNRITANKNYNLYFLNTKTKIIDTLNIPIKPSYPKVLKRNNKIYILEDTYLLNKLFVYDLSSKSFSSYSNSSYYDRMFLSPLNDIVLYKKVKKTEGESDNLKIIKPDESSFKINFKTKKANKIIVDKKGNIWVASNINLTKYSYSQLNFKTISLTTDQDFYLQNGVLDEHNNFWFSLGRDTYNGKGDKIINAQKHLCKYNLDNRLLDTLLSSTEEFQIFFDDVNNTLWLENKGNFWNVKNNALSKLNISPPLENNLSYIAIDGTIYAGNIKGKKTYILNGNKFEIISEDFQLNEFKMLDLKQTLPFLNKRTHEKNKEHQTIAYYNKTKKSIESIFELDSLEYGFSIAQANDSSFWVITYKNQKVYYSSSKLKLKKENAYQNSGVRNHSIKTAADKSGNIWASSNMGLNFLTIESDTIKSVLISKKEGLSSTIINDLYVDEHNFLWIATDNGVDRLNVTNFVNDGIVNIEHFGKAEGLKDLNCTKFVIRNKQLMTFTNSGYAVIDTSIQLTTLIAPNPFFTNLGYSVDGELKTVTNLSEKELEFNNPFGPIYIGYNAIEFNNTKPLQYTTILYKEGKVLYGNFDAINWSSQEEIKYEGLAPGNYKIEIYCRVGNKGVKSEPTILEFKILPAWWQTWWAKGLLVALILLAFYLLSKQRTKALIKRQEQLEETVEIKTAEVVVQKQEAEAQRDVAQEQRLIAEEKTSEIIDSLDYAKRLQKAILPSHRLVKEWLTESFILYKPKDIVSGDFYWMESVTPSGKDEKQLILFAAADCTGHGVPGAMVSVVCANALNRSVKEFGLTEPGLILDKVSELVIEAFEKSDDEIKDGMDIALCALEMSSKTLYYSGANNSLYRITNRIKGEDLSLKSSFTETHKLLEYKATKRPIGAHVSDNIFETQEIKLEPGDAIYLFSDGFADQFGGEKGKKLKNSSFRQLLLANHDLPMEEQKAVLDTAFENWKGEMEQIDDVCIIGVKINGVERNNFTESELKVLACLQEGLSSKLIADKLHLSKNTVDTYRRRLLAKTGTYNATELINYCVKKEII